MGESLRRLKSLDAFPKIQDDFYSKTLSGGVITIVCCAIMGALFLSELGSFVRTQSVHRLEVDTSRGETITIKLDLTLPRMPCDWLSVTAIDVSGNVQANIDHDLSRKRLDKHGRPLSDAEQHHVGTLGDDLPDHLHVNKTALPEGYCGSCFGAEDEAGQCCNTCDEVRTAYRTKGWVLPDYETVEQCAREGFLDALMAVKSEGCHLWGDIRVAKVAGKVQLLPGKVYEFKGQVLQDLAPLRHARLDLSHTVAQLSFGKPYPGQQEPLRGATFDQRKQSKVNPDGSAGVYNYFLKVVPTSYTTLWNVTTESSQYSVTEHFKPVSEAAVQTLQSTPGILFGYDLSAIKVNVVEMRTGILHFLTNVCAIVGGVFTVSGILDSTLYHGHRLIRKKKELGKFG